MRSFLCIIIACVACVGAAHAQVRDSSSRTLLPEVSIGAARQPSPLSSSAPTQTIDAERIERSGALLLSDAMKTMAGVTLKDYGGVGGMKTVSVRGLGSQFSTLAIDGIAVSDCQNGQVDLSRYLTTGNAGISLTQGQYDDLLQTARTYAAGNVVNIETAVPTFEANRRLHFTLSNELGSFGMWASTVALDLKAWHTTVISAMFNHIQSRGDYPFVLYYTSSQRDSSSVERRTNSSMWMNTLDLNVHTQVNHRSKLSTKLHYMQSWHNLPGPVTYYTMRNSEHSEEQLFMAQSRYSLIVDARTDLQVRAKYQISGDVYMDTAAFTTTGTLRNDYKQQEGYLSAVVRRRLGASFQLAGALDGAYNSLRSNLSSINNVGRESMLLVVAGSFRNSSLSATANILCTLIGEQARGPLSAQPIHNNYRKLSPYVALAFTPKWANGSTPKQPIIRLRYFFKETYRVPNFNELYYFTLLHELQPEKAHQHNIGLTALRAGFDSQWLPPTTSLSLTADAYHNSISNKIVAIPVQNMFLWSMINLDRVNIDGVDLTFNATLPFARTTLHINATYSFQHAVDRTDKASKVYGHQIPYTPRHSAGGNVSVETRIVTLDYSVTVAGKRYTQQQNTASSMLPAYSDHTLTASHCWHTRHGSITLRGQVLNLFDTQYEVVKSYPMMGRNYRIYASYQF